MDTQRRAKPGRVAGQRAGHELTARNAPGKDGNFPRFFHRLRWFRRRETQKGLISEPESMARITPGTPLILFFLLLTSG
ncbi:MAG: hypothetical protein Ct9H300mP16_08470 [Pseudomonadota bacterium]|nr:MAG: hypothetical protein Ct9H300mP16_08470 [Pseudomonadota bacterium]